MNKDDYKKIDELVKRYELETGDNAYSGGMGEIASSGYVRWLERLVISYEKM